MDAYKGSSYEQFAVRWNDGHVTVYRTVEAAEMAAERAQRNRADILRRTVTITDWEAV